MLRRFRTISILGNSRSPRTSSPPATTTARRTPGNQHASSCPAADRWGSATRAALLLLLAPAIACESASGAVGEIGSLVPPDSSAGRHGWSGLTPTRMAWRASPPTATCTRLRNRTGSGSARAGSTARRRRWRSPKARGTLHRPRHLHLHRQRRQLDGSGRRPGVSQAAPELGSKGPRRAPPMALPPRAAEDEGGLRRSA